MLVHRRRPGTHSGQVPQIRNMLKQSSIAFSDYLTLEQAMDEITSG
jgi:hypothetical protein